MFSMLKLAIVPSTLNLLSCLLLSVFVVTFVALFDLRFCYVARLAQN